MERTVLQAYDKYLSLQDIDNVEDSMSKEELHQMRFKMQSLMNNLLGIKNVQTRALMEQMFKRGYLAAHIVPGDELL